MNVRQTFDIPLVSSIFAEPSCYTPDDGSPAAEEFEALNDPRVVYLLVEADGTFGVVAFVPMNFAAYQAHATFLPGMRKGASAGLRKAFAWLFSNSFARSISGFIPESNRPARHLAVSAGMTRVGELPYAFQRGGNSESLVIYEVHKCPAH